MRHRRVGASAHDMTGSTNVASVHIYVRTLAFTESIRTGAGSHCLWANEFLVGTFERPETPGREIDAVQDSFCDRELSTGLWPRGVQVLILSQSFRIRAYASLT